MSDAETSDNATSANTEEDLRTFILRLHQQTQAKIDTSEHNIKVYVDQQCEALSNKININTDDINKLKGNVIENKNTAHDNTTEVGKLIERVGILEYDVKTLRESNTEANKKMDVQAIEMATLRYRL